MKVEVLLIVTRDWGELETAKGTPLPVDCNKVLTEARVKLECGEVVIADKVSGNGLLAR